MSVLATKIKTSLGIIFKVMTSLNRDVIVGASRDYFNLKSRSVESSVKIMNPIVYGVYYML